jgi:hypothetical protein
MSVTSSTGYYAAPQTRASSGAASAKNPQNPPETALFATKNPDGTITMHLTDEEITALMAKVEKLPDDLFVWGRVEKTENGQDKLAGGFIGVGDKGAIKSVIREMMLFETMLLRFKRRYGLLPAELRGEFFKGQNLSVKV